MAKVTAGAVAGFNMFDMDIGGIAEGDILSATPTQIVIGYGGGDTDTFIGSFTYAGSNITGGTLNRIEVRVGNALVWTASDFSASVPQFLAWLAADDTEAAVRSILSGADEITGSSGADVLYGVGGNDRLDGGAGTDTVVYDGASASYTWIQTANGWTVTDNRAGSPDGTDTLVGIEALRFSDRTVSLTSGGPNQPVPAVTTGIASILRGSNAALEADLSAKVSVGALTQAQAIGEIVKAADQTTSVATLSYLFFTGKIPGSAGIDYLVSASGPNPNNLNSAYFQNFNLENRYINFAVNLGRDGEGKAAFQADYGSLSLFDATKKAYAEIFGGTPTDAKVTALLSGGRDAYFASYGGDGLAGQGTKAAMVGWLLAEAEKGDLGVMARSNAAWLTDLADGSAPFAIDITAPGAGYYKSEFVFGG
ncbi:hypothetical protein P7B02_06470 [Caulobacter segnis]|uniref:hypothetical protein n=1 Tax=Caulobacter segnis TaxID=88688 RepID=UPI00240F19DF|nr:hypothetical protein [Caulobacter segnis]MDG2521182.1 hypothetical protein [Caulobacter segnis]